MKHNHIEFTTQLYKMLMGTRDKRSHALLITPFKNEELITPQKKTRLILPLSEF